MKLFKYKPDLRKIDGTSLCVCFPPLDKLSLKDEMSKIK